jgi:hypothetical protein
MKKDEVKAGRIYAARIDRRCRASGNPVWYREVWGTFVLDCQKPQDG